MIDPQLQKDLNRVLERVANLSPATKRAAKKELKGAAAPLVTAVKSVTPVGNKVHRRYAKSKGKRAAKGTGKVVATYKPGNLKKSISFLNFRRAKTSVFVGARLGLKTTDGYYGNWVDKGARNVDGSTRPGSNFFSRGVNSVQAQVLRSATERIRTVILKIWTK